MLERAVRRNPRAPDFEGLSSYLAHVLDSNGGVQSSAFATHIADIQKVDAIIMKQHRLVAEETKASKNRRKGVDDKESTPKAKAKGKAKAQAG